MGLGSSLLYCGVLKSSIEDGHASIQEQTPGPARGLCPASCQALVDLNKFLLDNLDKISAVSDPLPPGTELLVCGGTSQAATRASGTWKARFDSSRPFIGANPVDYNTPYVQGNAAILTMFNTMRAFDGRSLFLQHGPIAKICTWKPEGGSLSMIQVTYGAVTADAYGERPEDIPLVTNCVRFGPQEKIIQIDTWYGLLVDGLRFHTTDQSRAKNWPTLLTGKEEKPIKELKAPPGGYLAAISGFTAKYNYYIPGGATYDMVAGLQFDWALD